MSEKITNPENKFPQQEAIVEPALSLSDMEKKAVEIVDIRNKLMKKIDLDIFFSIIVDKTDEIKKAYVKETDDCYLYHVLVSSGFKEGHVPRRYDFPPPRSIEMFFRDWWKSVENSSV